METDTFVVLAQSPAECSEKDLNAFEDLVNAGEEVFSGGLRKRIESARLLSLCKTPEGAVVGVAALKNPNPNYRDLVFKKSRSKEEASRWCVELGWIFVRSEFRGRRLVTRLVRELFSNYVPKGVYATAREKNDPIMPLLKRFRFDQSGHSYRSENGDYNLVLYIKRD